MNSSSKKIFSFNLLLIFLLPHAVYSSSFQWEEKAKQFIRSLVTEEFVNATIDFDQTVSLRSLQKNYTKSGNL